ncbi:MAG: hypothetical protein KC917_22790, partial [Candidatus Omnitrophica bacterium]|nr:hypothetical protein [Candidatus Omnitrophota bacterium]
VVKVNPETGVTVPVAGIPQSEHVGISLIPDVPPFNSEQPTETPTLSPTSTPTPTLTPSPTATPTPTNPGPTNPVVHITPEEPNTLDDLIATVSGSVDPDGGDLSYAFEWFRDGESQNETSFGSEESSVVSHDRTTRGEVWKCLVTVQDDEGQSVTGEDEVTIQNSLPTQPEIKTLPPNPMPGDGIAVLITKQSTDADGDVIVYLFEWYRLNSDGFWERRPEVSGNLSPFSPGEPEISGLYTAGEMWEVRVTPYEARTLVKRSGQKGV